VQEDLVIGEAVVLELRTARLASRALAVALDVAAQLVLLLAGLIPLAVLGGLDDALLTAVVLTFSVLVLVGYPVTFETLSRGRTLGKMALGLRVVRDDGGPIRFRHALTRGLTGVVVDFGPLWTWSAVAVMVSLFSPRSKRVGDFLAGTTVIRDRVPRSGAPALAMPPALAQWASLLDLSGLSDELALAVRQYLARFGELSPAARDALGGGLAGEVARWIAAPVPPGVPAWAYLTAVLVERRQRDQASSAGHVPPPPAGHDPGARSGPGREETAPEHPFAPPG
jgi:uncharacterized RDD family membrane protein YckC